MARENPQKPQQPQKQAERPQAQAARGKRRRRPRGVPKALAFTLIALALIVGGGLGFLLGGGNDNTSSIEYETQIANANQRIAELEEAMIEAGLDPSADVLDGLNPLDPEVAAALSGNDEPVNNNNALVASADSFSQPESTKAPTVVAEFDGVQIMSDEVLDAYNATINSQLLMGQDVSSYADSIMEETLSNIIADRITDQQPQELGLTTLTEEDSAAIEAKAQADFEGQLEFYLTDEEDAASDEARQSAIERMAADGVTLDSLREEYTKNWWEDKLFTYVTSDVTVSEERLQQTYDLYLADQQTLYEASLEQYEMARRYGDEVVVYNPAGYRTFKQVLIAFEQADSQRVSEILSLLASLDETADAQQIAELNGELDTLYAKLEPTANEVLDLVAQGAEFDTLISQYGQDPNQDLDGVQRDGYYVCAESTSYDSAVTQAVMALENPGEVTTQAVRTSEGLHILYYASNVPAGEVPLDEVRDALEADVLVSMQYEAYDEQLTQWVEDTDIVYHREALQ